MKKIPFLFAVALLLIHFSSNVTAKIGETKAEIAKRYGPSKQTGPVRRAGLLAEGCEQAQYDYNNFEITVIFQKGKSAEESLVPREERWMNNEECEKLGESIGGTNAWTQTDDTGSGTFSYTRWQSKDKRLMMGRIGRANKTTIFTVWTGDFQKLLDASLAKQIKREQQNRTQGF